MRGCFQIAQHMVEEVVRIRIARVAVSFKSFARTGSVLRLAVVEDDNLVDLEDCTCSRHLRGHHCLEVMRLGAAMKD